jgi:hypothetical protein
MTNTSKCMWSSVLNNVKCFLHESYNRDLCLLRRARFVHTYLLSKIWYCTQLLPTSEDYTRQRNSVIAWFIWAQETCRVRLSALYIPSTEDGTNLIEVQAKYHALFICRYLIRLQKETPWKLNGSTFGTHTFPLIIHQAWELLGKIRRVEA